MIKYIEYNDDNHEAIVTIDLEGTPDAEYYALRIAMAFFQNNDGLFRGVKYNHSAHEAIIYAYVGTPTEYNHGESVNKVCKVFEKAIKNSAPTNTIPIDKAMDAYCKSKGCGIPSSTCHSLDTCEGYDAFAKALREQMEGGGE